MSFQPLTQPTHKPRSFPGEIVNLNLDVACQSNVVWFLSLAAQPIVRFHNHRACVKHDVGHTIISAGRWADLNIYICLKEGLGKFKCSSNTVIIPWWFQNWKQSINRDIFRYYNLYNAHKWVLTQSIHKSVFFFSDFHFKMHFVSDLHEFHCIKVYELLIFARFKWLCLFDWDFYHTQLSFTITGYQKSTFLCATLILLSIVDGQMWVHTFHYIFFVFNYNLFQWLFLIYHIMEEFNKNISYTYRIVCVCSHTISYLNMTWISEIIITAQHFVDNAIYTRAKKSL